MVCERDVCVCVCDLIYVCGVLRVMCVRECEFVQVGVNVCV